MKYFDLSKLLELKLAILLLISTVGAIIYRVYSLNAFGIGLSIGFSAVVFLILAHFGLNFNVYADKKTNIPTGQSTNSKLSSILLWYFLSFALLLVIIVSLSATSKSITSPWEVIPVWFFYLYFAFVLIGFTLACLYRHTTPSYIIFGISLLIVPVVYQIGYGYDFFIHGASLRQIDEIGQILPKTNFYLGQYSLIIILHKLFALPIIWLHKFLVPAFSAIFIPYFIIKYLKSLNRPNWQVLTLLLLPISFLTFTTPQNFGYAILIILIFSLLSAKTRNDLILNGLLVLVGLTIHPISGLPGLMLFVLRYLQNNHLKHALLIISPFVLPLLYYLATPGASLTWPNLVDVASKFIFTVPYKFNALLNLIYLFNFNSTILILGLVALGFFVRGKDKIFNYFSYFLVALLVSSVVMSMIGNDALINYEQTDYAERLNILMLIVALPLIFNSIHYLYGKISTQNTQIKIAFSALFLFALTANLYLIYPRIDQYTNSKGLSTSRSDLEAVTWVDENAPKDYVVLANQQVSAGALHLFGFKKYYNNGVFYYPVPTGGPLYQYYLDMVYKKPSSETMAQAKQFAGVDTAYFVINKYWTDSAKIIEEAKITSKNYQVFGNGDVWVFKY